MVRVEDAETLIKFLCHGRVVACTLAYDMEHAELTGRILLRGLEQCDSVLIVPFENGHEVRDARFAKEARRDMKNAYKEGLISPY